MSTPSFNDDGDALMIVRRMPDAKISGGMITVPEGYKPTPEEEAAINYLCSEWDYAFDWRSK
jgi:hypothetical protein